MSAPPLHDPPEPTFTEMIGYLLSGQAQTGAIRLEEEAQYQCGLELSRQIASATGLGMSEAFWSLGHLPDNMLSLLCSPQGWIALATYVAHDLGIVPPDFNPTIH